MADTKQMELPEPITDFSKLADLKTYPEGEAVGTLGATPTGLGYIFVIMEFTKQYGTPGATYTYYFKIVGCGDPWTYINTFLKTGNPRPMYGFNNPRFTHVTQTANALNAAVQAVTNYKTTIGGGNDWFYVEHADLNSFWNSIQTAIQPYIG